MEVVVVVVVAVVAVVVKEHYSGSHPDFNLRKYLYYMAGVDFTLIDGLDALSCANYIIRSWVKPRAFSYTHWLYEI
jgi:hypothetical protein